MTVLGKEDIRRSLVYHDTPLVEGRSVDVEPASVDVHLGEELLIEEKTGTTIDVTDESTYPDYYERQMEDGYTISSKDFVLGTTEETINIPNRIVGFLHGRSSVGRLGMFIENAGLIDPGFSGEITLELFNASRNPIRLQEGMRIGQITFHDVKSVPDVGYSERNGNKYDKQEGTTPSRLHEDFE